MDIDIEQLPIPDWNLYCRGCGYALKGLPEHRCPECGREIVMAQVIQSWSRLREPVFRGDELPMPDFGLRCAECETPLAGAHDHTCPHCAAPFDPLALLPQREWAVVPKAAFGGLLDHQIELLLADAYIPFMRRQHQDVSRLYGLDAKENVRFEIPREFYFDLLEAVQRHEREAPAPGTPDWTCTSCGESNPASFQICWQCHHARPP